MFLFHASVYIHNCLKCRPFWQNIKKNIFRIPGSQPTSECVRKIFAVGGGGEQEFADNMPGAAAISPSEFNKGDNGLPRLLTVSSKKGAR